MSKNTNQTPFTEQDAARMHGTEHVPQDLLDLLGVQRSDVLLKEAVDKITLNPNPSPEFLRDATGALLLMFSKTRMGEIMASKSAPGQRENAINNLLATLSSEYKTAIAKMGRGQLDNLADILVQTGNMRPLMMQVEMGHSLLPARAQNIFAERSKKLPSDVAVLHGLGQGSSGTDFVEMALRALPPKPGAPDYRAAVDAVAKSAPNFQALFDKQVEEYTGFIRALVNYEPGASVATVIEELQKGSSRERLEQIASNYSNGSVRNTIDNARRAQKKAFDTILKNDRIKFYTALDTLEVLDYFLNLISKKDSTLPQAIEREMVAYSQDPNGPYMLRALNSELQKLDGAVQLLAAHVPGTGMDSALSAAQALLQASRNNELKKAAVSKYKTRASRPAHLAITAMFERVFAKLDADARERFIVALYDVGMLDVYKDVITAGNSRLPIDIQHAIKAWVPTKAAMKIVELDALLPQGEEEHTDVVFGRGTRSPRSEFADLQPEPRMEWILDALAKDGFSEKHMVLYREKTLGRETKRPPYVVLDVKKDDQHFQIAICEVKGNTTYVIRTPIDFDGGKIVTIADLKHDKTVFQCNCYTPVQWARNVRYYAYSNVGDLKVQLKTRLGWSDKKDDLIQSFAEFHLETGQFPLTHDNSIIEHGPLAGRATWARAYRALYKQAIKGLDHVRNFTQLRDEVFDKGNSLPPAADKVCAAEPVDATTIFNGAVAFMSENPNTLPANDIAGISIEAIDRSFRLGKVANLERFVDVKNGGKLTTIQDFMMAVGLAEKGQNGVISPVNPAMVHTIKRLVIGN